MPRGDETTGQTGITKWSIITHLKRCGGCRESGVEGVVRCVRGVKSVRRGNDAGLWVPWVLLRQSIP